MLATACPAAAQTRGLFSIDSFVTSLVVNADGSLIVREDITFDFRGSHQGIFRRIPLRYMRDGLEFPLTLRGIGAYDESNRPLRTEVSYPDRSVVIKAWVPGAADTKKTVSVVYHVRRGVFAYEDHDEVYWNATGTEWNVPIRTAEVYVTLPAGIGDADVRTTAYTGGLGAIGRDYAVDRVQGYWRFRTTRALRPREGVTVLVGWPPGHVAHPSELRRAGWLVADYWPLGLPALALIWGGIVWWAFGRDPGGRRSVKPEYAPPPDMIPAEGGALLDERAHPRDVIATVVDLAERGYLSIEPITTAFGSQDFMFKRLKPIAGDPELKDFELFVLAKVFGGDWAINMRLLSEVRHDYDNVFPPIRDRLYRLMVQDGLFPASPGHVRAGSRIGFRADLARDLRAVAPSRRDRERPRLRRLGVGHAAQDVDGRAAGGAGARLPGVPGARGEGSPRAPAGRHLPSLAAVGDRARRDRTLDLQLPGPQGRRPIVVSESRRFLVAELRS